MIDFNKILPSSRLTALFVMFFHLLSHEQHAQLIENFSDGEFGSNPTWNGNPENFIVNSDFELQLNDLDPLLTQSYLSVSNTQPTLNDIEWRVKIKQTFAGSDANQSRVYLTSDQPIFGYSGNNSAGVSGYFLKLGEGLSGDVVRFYKDDGLNATLIASCTTNISASFEISLKINRDNGGNWTIAIDPSAGENYAVEASFVESAYNTAEYFGIVCTYTTSNATKFYFDDIYCGAPIVDVAPPIVLSATATSETTVDVLFDEAVDLTTSQTNTSYNAATIGAPINAQRDASNTSLVHLTFGTSFNLNQEYELNIAGVADENGNIMLTNEQETFMWYILGFALPRDVVFNEIFADPTPSVSLPEVEFVEILNTHATSSFNLNNWAFVNSSTAKFLPAYLLPPGGHLILCDEQDIALFESYGAVLGIPSFPALTNSGDSLTLINPGDVIIDVVVYSSAWYNTEEGLDGGYSLELINPEIPCQAVSNWTESTSLNGGTPGVQNSVYDLTPDTTPPTVSSFEVTTSTSIVIQFNEAMDTTGNTIPQWDIIPFISIVNATWNSTLDRVTLIPSFPVVPPNTYQITIFGIADCSGNSIITLPIEFTLGFEPTPGDLIINEIMADEDPAIGMPDAEYIELRNNSNNLLDLSNVRLNSGYFTGQILLEPDSLLVVANINNAGLFASIENAAFMTSFPGLTNSGASLDLTNEAEQTIDFVDYNLNWYNDNTKTEGGWSMERINPNAICSGRYNWRASIDPRGGTAGEENSVYSLTPNGAPQVTDFGFFNATQIYIRFNESMDINSTSDMSFVFNPGNSVETPVWNSDKDQVIFNMAFPIIEEVTYELSLIGLKDCDGNQVTLTTVNFIIGLEPQQGDLIINEILADGTSDQHIASPRLDFVELHNRTSHILELTEIHINDGFFEEQVIIYPDSFIIVTDSDNPAINFFAFPNTVFMQDFPSLTEDGTDISLTGNGGELDFVRYSKSYYNNPEVEDGGYSMELINPEDPCSSSDNWRACTFGNGTSAGRKNSVFDLTPDTQAPELLFIVGENENAILLYFNEPLDAASADNLTWVVNDVVQTDFNPNVIGDDNNALILYYEDMVPGVIYKFELTGVSDCWGNLTATLLDQFGLSEPAQVGDLIINEVLYNPKDGGSDFVEIYNRSPRIISLKDWAISDATNGEMNTSDKLALTKTLLFPGEYLVITKESSTLAGIYPETKTERLWEVKGIPDFSSEDEVYLLTPDSLISDHFIYDESLQFPLLTTSDGVSLERIAFDRSSEDVTNWHSAAESVGYATPGYLNSQSATSEGTEEKFAVETEIFSPDNDGYKDVALFSYKMDEPGYVGDIRIYDSEGRFIRHLMKNELLGISGSISWDGFTDEQQKATIGIYIVLFEAFNPSGNTTKSKKTCVLAHALN
jgi:hypothetical protein